MQLHLYTLRIYYRLYFLSFIFCGTWKITFHAFIFHDYFLHLQKDTHSRITFGYYNITDQWNQWFFLNREQTSAVHKHVWKSKLYVIKAIRSIHRTPKSLHQSILPFRGNTRNILLVFSNELQFNMQRKGRAIPITLCVQLPM